MSCGLKKLLAFSAFCEGDGCVYWRQADAEDDQARPGCVLDEFSLTGTVADRLTRWLLAYKFSTDRASTAAAVRSHDGAVGLRASDAR